MRSSTRGWDVRAQLTLWPTALRGLPARHRVKLALHHGIMSGAIPGGTHLVQSVIADEFAVSTHQVREALRDLAAEGFVRIDARGAAVVNQLCRGDLEDIYQIRLLLEPVAVARVAVLVREDTVIRAVKLLAAMESETDAERWAGLDSGFHRALSESGNSPRQAAILENLREHSARYVQHSILAAPGRARESSAEHEEIMRAVMKGDSDAAADAMFRHLDGTLAALRVREVTQPAGAHAGARQPIGGPAGVRGEGERPPSAGGREQDSPEGQHWLYTPR
jgi:DNA-binding GntR family transcriptional regulator